MRLKCQIMERVVMPAGYDSGSPAKIAADDDRKKMSEQAYPNQNEVCYSNAAIPAETKSDEEVRLRRGIEDIINDINSRKVKDLGPVIFRLKSLIVK